MSFLAPAGVHSTSGPARFPRFDGLARDTDAALAEIHGQHDARALVDAGTHRGLLDAYGRLDDDAAAVEKHWVARRDAEDAVAKHRAEIERAAREADWLRHAVEELQKLAPE